MRNARVGGAVSAAALVFTSAAAVAIGGGEGATVAERGDRLGDPVQIAVERFVPPRRAIMISDSVLAGVDVSGADERLIGAQWYTEPGVCRRLVGTSCKATGSPRPPTLLQELSQLPFTPDRYDLLVIATGYNDSAFVLDDNFDPIVATARARGFEQIAWLTYRTAMGGFVGDNARNLNAALLVHATADPDVHLWDFNAASFGQPWFAGDNTHLSPTGAVAVAEWLSAQVSQINVAD